LFQLTGTQDVTRSRDSGQWLHDVDGNALLSDVVTRSRNSGQCSRDVDGNALLADDVTRLRDSGQWPCDVGGTALPADDVIELPSSDGDLMLDSADNLTQFEIDAFHREDIDGYVTSSPSTPASLLSHPDFVDQRPDIYRFAYNITPVSQASNECDHVDDAACDMFETDELSSSQTTRDHQQSGMLLS